MDGVERLCLGLCDATHLHTDEAEAALLNQAYNLTGVAFCYGVWLDHAESTFLGHKISFAVMNLEI